MRYLTTARIWQYWKASILFFAGICVGDAIRNGSWIPGIASLIWLALFCWAKKVEAVDINELRAQTEELRRMTDEIKQLKLWLSPSERN